MREVRLYGALAREFGPVHRLAVASPAEAVRALCANFRGFERFVVESSDRGVGYKVFDGAGAVPSADMLHFGTGTERPIRIAPVVMGAKDDGLGMIFLGAALIGASFFLPTTPLFSVTLGGSVFAPSLASIAFNVGLGLALQGVSSLLSPQPKAVEVSERPENKPSYTFDGPVNTAAQGQPVPLGYGKIVVGGAVISAGVYTEDIPA